MAQVNLAVSNKQSVSIPKRVSEVLWLLEYSKRDRIQSGFNP